MNAAFYFFAVLTVISALVAVGSRNVFYSVLSLILFFTSLAGLYLALFCEFLAVVQILIYVGAVGIVMLFAVMLTRHVSEDAEEGRLARGFFWGVAIAGMLGGMLLVPMIEKSMVASSRQPSAVVLSAGEIGRMLVGSHVVPLMGMAVLLTVALVAAVVLALGEGRKSGAREGGE